MIAPHTVVVAPPLDKHPNVNVEYTEATAQEIRAVAYRTLENVIMALHNGCCRVDDALRG
jgi:hypothetical protein